MGASLAPSKGKHFLFPAEAAKVQRPRTKGITHVLDRLGGLHEDELAYLAPYIDVAKIGWGLPLLLPREEVRRRIKLYHHVGVEVSTGGTLLEWAVTRDRTEALMDEAKELGFDILEISNGIIELSVEQIEGLAAEAARRKLDVFIEVGKKDPEHQLSLKETIQQVARARELHPRKVILESRESGRNVGIYDGEGSIKWDWVRAILSDFPRDDLIIEAPMESQQIGLLRRLGADVNLGNVALASVAPLASERLGLRGETFGAIRTSRTVRGPPGTKFLYYLLETYRGLDQTELMQLSRLPRRTVQSGLESLRRQGLVQESVSLTDSRRHEYRLS
ncbi:MAG: phosphosulfolactate synthase [Thermoplasmata archaeon]